MITQGGRGNGKRREKRGRGSGDGKNEKRDSGMEWEVKD